MALKAIGARKVPVAEIEMCARNAARQTIEITHPLTSDADAFHAYALPDPRIADGATKHMWSFGTRHRPTALGQWSNLRKVNWRELLQIPQADRQIGVPCSVHTDASLGWALYTYQPYEILMDNCQRAQNVRLGGAKEQSSAKGQVRPMSVLLPGSPCPHPSHLWGRQLWPPQGKGSSTLAVVRPHGIPHLCGRYVFQPVWLYSGRAEVDCDQTRCYAFASHGFSGPAPRRSFGAVGAPTGFGGCAFLTPDAHVPVPCDLRFFAGSKDFADCPTAPSYLSGEFLFPARRSRGVPPKDLIRIGSPRGRASGNPRGRALGIGTATIGVENAASMALKPHGAWATFGDFSATSSDVNRLS